VTTPPGDSWRDVGRFCFVTDTQTDTTVAYDNPSGAAAAAAIQDTEAFATCP
jgi:hypothetical protein